MTAAAPLPATSNARIRRGLLASLAVLGCLRLATLGLVPLLDRSEARYAEIGRVMAVSGEWLTPQLEPGVPFWGKPPLHFWATAASLRAFGADAFAARLPSLLGALALVLVALRVARALRADVAPALAALVLASSVLCYTLAAQVALDLTLAVCISGALGAWLLAQLAADPREARRWFALAFLALGAGLLAKGPVALALCAATLALACVATRDLRWLRGVPWGWGLALAAAVGAPWYWAAERSTPGFLEYFFVHENFLRFLVADYGDRYGHGHTLPYGTIWGFAALALLPWTPAILVLVWRGRRSAPLARLRDDPARAFLWAWSLAPLLFFTASRSVVVTYVLPALPAIAILLADALAPRESESPAAGRPDLTLALLAGAALVLAGVGVGAAVLAQRIAVPASAFVLLGGALLAGAVALSRCARSARPLALVIATALCVPFVDAAGRGLLAREIGALASTRELAAEVAAIRRERPCALAFFRDVPASARFELADAAGQALEGDPARLQALAATSECSLVALRSRDLRRLSPEALNGLEPLQELGSYVLFGNAAAGARAPAAAAE
jgi:4-amino-4-deoxy-L-arabinose transferase-like glycosyltransferase